MELKKVDAVEIAVENIAVATAAAGIALAGIVDAAFFVVPAVLGNAGVSPLSVHSQNSLAFELLKM